MSYQRKIAKLAKKGMRCFLFFGKYNELYYSRTADYVLDNYKTSVGELPQEFVDSISNSMTETDNFVVVSLYDNKGAIQTNSLPNTGFA